MKIMLKKMLKFFVPNGLIWLRRKFVKRIPNMIYSPSPRGGLSPVKVSFPPPSNVIPDKIFEDYAMNGKINVLYAYSDDRVLDNTKTHNTPVVYKRVFRLLSRGKFPYYGAQGKAFFDALLKYPLKDKNVMIWGLAGCNCEALAVWGGGRKVYVIDYNKPICEHERIEVLNHDELVKKEITVDIAFSYSSFEHDGLGRYGDPLSADGDLRAMENARQYLNTGGILFLGVPLGQDCLVWNMHRIYGKIRLPLLLKGWCLVDVFDVHKDLTPLTQEYPFDLPLGEHIQNILVLKKINKDFPDDAYLTGRFEENKSTYASNIMCERVNKIIYEFKSYK